MIRREMTDISTRSEVLNVLPFEEYEQALWALRVEDEWSPMGKGALDIFGLATYPTEDHQHLGTPVAGELAYVVRGQSRSLIDLLDAAEQWWAQFRGLTFRGRPKGTGTWRNREHFLDEAKAVVTRMRIEGENITQESVAARLFTNDRQLREWIKNFNATWQEIREG